MILRVALIQCSISALCDGCRQFVTRFTFVTTTHTKLGVRRGTRGIHFGSVCVRRSARDGRVRATFGARAHLPVSAGRFFASGVEHSLRWLRHRPTDFTVLPLGFIQPEQDIVQWCGWPCALRVLGEIGQLLGTPSISSSWSHFRMSTFMQYLTLCALGSMERLILAGLLQG
jgi:hypothetical protein